MEKVFVRCDMLKDSGERREFQTGAVRDIVSGKGRCDLMPLGEVSVLLSCFDDMNFCYAQILFKFKINPFIFF